MIRWIKSWASGLVASAMLVGCGGGGGDAGGCVFDCSAGTSVETLVVTLSSQSLPNTGSDVVTATITALNGDRVAVSGAPVAVAVDANAVVTLSGASTDANGVVTATVGIGADKANRTVTLTVTSGTVETTASFQVTGSRISATYTGTVATNSPDNAVVYQVTDVNGNALVGQPIEVSAPGLTTVEGTTDSAGRFTYTYTAPPVAGDLTITATAAGVSNNAIVVVQSVGAVPPVGDGVIVGSASIAASPNKVTVNAVDSVTNQAQVRVLFVQPNNAPIQNMRVRFDLNGDPNGVGGTFSSGTDILYSSANGTVITAYIPGTRASPTDGVVIRACYAKTDAALAGNACPQSVMTTLTVTDEAISVTLGTNELIEEGEAKLTYIKKFVVMVVDSAGNAMSGVTISPVVDLTNYAKGTWRVAGDVWVPEVTGVCINEDVDRDGILDGGEDLDSDSVLEPRKADVSIRMVDSNRTDTSGLAILQIEYPKNVASWVRYLITVTASGISGTEGRATFAGWLDVSADAVSDTDVSPAFVFSPYGQTSSCTDPL